MPNFRVTTTVARSDTPLKCFLDNQANGVKILRAACSDVNGAKTTLQVAADGLSLAVPIAVAGVYYIGVTVNKIAGAAVNIDEGSVGGPFVLALYPGNVSKSGTFSLEVTP